MHFLHITFLLISVIAFFATTDFFINKKPSLIGLDFLSFFISNYSAELLLALVFNILA